MSLAFPSPAAERRPRASPGLSEVEVLLDLSRLLSRVMHPTPTGVDRVEMAYAQTLLKLAPERVRFAASHPCGLHGRVATKAALAFLELTARRWEGEGQAGRQSESRAKRWSHAVRSCLALTPTPGGGDRRRRAYLHLSARRLERTAMLEALLRRERAAFIPFVHDLIPMEFPEYARPSGTALHRRKIETVTRLAAGVIVNSEATARALAPHFQLAGRSAPIRVAALAPAAFAKPAAPMARAEAPYFVALSTIEPRKNHLLLLNLWRRFVETRGAADTPKLVLIGRRGWENENILDLLDRCPALRGVVEERSRLPDREVARVVGGARALLVPSFAEGFGLPVVEALALGVPVIASDLAALREAGAGVPDYLDPLDGPAWARAILDYAAPASIRRAEQLRRLTSWTAPTWEAHVQVALQLIDEVCP